MPYSAKIICDSISETGKRLTTFEITFPRIVLAEFNTHRMFSRNSASSRAIPFEKQIDRVIKNPFMPEQFPLNCKGMQPQEYITQDNDKYLDYKCAWLNARDAAIHIAKSMFNEGNVHKQIVNRLLEPFQWHTVIVTATEWDNFFKLRTNENAQYEIRRIANLMYELYHNASDSNQYSKPIAQPKILTKGEWHLPFISHEDEQEIIKVWSEKTNYKPEEIEPETLLLFKKRISVARCARVSYLTHDGKRNIEEDLKLFEKLRTSGHWSPFEDVATPHFQDFGTDFGIKEGSYDDDNDNRQFHNERYCNLNSGNFIGWRQYRKEFQDENCTHFRKA